MDGNDREATRGRLLRHVRRVVAVGVAVVVAATAAVVVGAAGPRGPAADAAVVSDAPRVTVTDVGASATTSGSRTTVRATVRVANRTREREPSSVVWLSLVDGERAYTLGPVAVAAVPAGSSAVVRTTQRVPLRVPARTYTVQACSGPYSATNCRRSGHTVTTVASRAGAPENGVMLDLARAYYPVQLIERYVDLLPRHGGSFLHLHLTDDQNVGIESAVLGQTTANADLRNGVWTSRVTHRPFLSAAQARAVSAYAAAKGITVVPEIDTPGHMGAAFALLEARHGRAWVDRIRSGPDELDTSAPGSSALAAALLHEVSRTFPSSRAVHVGGDEWGADVTADQRVAWLDAMAAAAGDREVWAWNDGIDRSAIRRLDPRIRVTYWSFDGDTEDPAERRDRRRHRAGADDLATAGIDLLDYDSYYLYSVPTDLDPADSAYAAADIRAHWTLRTWDGASGSRLRAPMGGAAVAIWGEDLDTPPSDALLRWSTPQVEAVLETARR